MEGSNKRLDDQVASIIKTVLDKCRYEKQHGILVNPIHDYQARAAYYTASCRELVKEIEDKWHHKQNIRQMSNIHGYLVWKTINYLILNKRIPGYKNAYTEYTSQCIYKSVPSLNYQQFMDVLEAMGFRLHKTKNEKWLLLENPKFTFERFSYLSKVIKYRKTFNKQFYYVDERSVDSTLEFQKAWLKDIPTATSSEISVGCTYYYMVSVQVGYVSGLFCSEASNSSFKKWLIEIALPKINPQSVIVMDKNCYKKLFEQSISRYNSKNDMMEWLHDKQIPHCKAMSKAELYELISTSTGTKRYSEAYNFIRACGHDVLCLPSTLMELSLADKVWTLLKNGIQPREMSIGEVKNWVLTNISSINEHDWQTQEEDIIKLEEELHSTDLALEEYLEKNYELINIESDENV